VVGYTTSEPPIVPSVGGDRVVAENY